MCGPKKPKMQKPTIDPELREQNEAAMAKAQDDRFMAKKKRTEDAIAEQGGLVGRGALLTGSRGGLGYAMPARSLFASIAA